MNWNWNFIVVGAVLAVGGVAYAYYQQKKKAKQSFPDYCSECEKIAEKEMALSYNVKKAILILAKVDEEIVAPFLYKSYQDGKVRKKQVNKSYPIMACPPNIQDAILTKGEFLIKKY